MPDTATRGAAFCVLAALIGFPWVSVAGQARNDVCETLGESIPQRSAISEEGSQFAAEAARLDGTEREALIRKQLLSGNIPAFLKRLEPVTFEGSRADGKRVRVTICVAPDYLAIGSDDDYLRIPMGLDTAAAVAERFGFVLPTRKMVDAIYDQAQVRLKPQPMTPGTAMVSTDYFVRHNNGIDEQRAHEGTSDGRLMAGHKKDLVLTNRLREKPGRVAIYGWHRKSGDPIQPLSTVHGAAYADYSHGVRLVSKVAYVNGKPTPIALILEDSRLADLLSDEGAIPRVAGLMRDISGAVRTANRSVSSSDKDS